MVIKVIMTFYTLRPQIVLAGFGLQASIKTHKPAGPLRSSASPLPLSADDPGPQSHISAREPSREAEPMSHADNIDSLSLTVPTTHQECPGSRLRTLTFSTFLRETDKLLSYLDVYSLTLLIHSYL